MGGEVQQNGGAPRTMLDKIWAEHVIVQRPGGEELMFVDLNLLHEGGTFMAFDQLRAEGRRARAALEVVGARRAAERHVEVRVRVDAAGDDVLAGCVDHPVAIGGCGAGQVHGPYDLALDEHVLGDPARGTDDGAVLDDDAHVDSSY